MADVDVRVFREGQEVARILRPLRQLNGKPAITYKSQLWPLLNGCEIHLDTVAPGRNTQQSATLDRAKKDPALHLLAVPPALIEWDESQRDVIKAAPGDRLLVGAGPGTGKTAVACARVSQLVDHCGLEPSRIWLISFTRTAVREIRERIAAYLEDPTAAYAVKIATLDSHAWTIHSGFDDEARILGSYEENIERVLDLVLTNENVSEYLERVEHLIVDEAQDIVSVRADLVVGMICRLSKSTGVTVFADEAQAIYGFADDREVEAGAEKEQLLTSKLRRGDAGLFIDCELTDIHRTDSPQLLTIFSETRRKVLAPGRVGSDHLAEIRDDILRLAHGRAPSFDCLVPAELSEAFILYRRRCDVLLTSSMLTNIGVAHRVRMSGLPACLAPWIGATLSEHTAPDLGRDAFIALWASRVGATSSATCQPEEAWDHLLRTAGRTAAIVDMRLLRQRLGRKQPPAELCQSEWGGHGPIVGTIHASKGREADTVHLMLPNSPGHSVDFAEEARIAFVGATRGRSRLLVGRGYRQRASRVEASGRSYCLQTKDGRPRAQFEIGRDGDISPEGLVGRRYFSGADEVRTSQNRIGALTEIPISLVASIDRAAGFAYRMRENGHEQCLAVLSQSVNADLFSIANAIQASIGGGKRRPPDVLHYLHVLGVRTVVLPLDSPECEALHEPWRSSGIALSPLVLGYTTAFFPSINAGLR